MAQTAALSRRAADMPFKQSRLCRMTEGCTPTEARLSTGRPGLLLPFPASRVVGTEHWAAPKAGLFFATLFNPRAAPWGPVASSLPQATEFNPGTALQERWWKTAGQLRDYKVCLSSLSAALTVRHTDDKIRTRTFLNNNILNWFLFNLKKRITWKCYTEFYRNIFSYPVYQHRLPIGTQECRHFAASAIVQIAKNIEVK